MCASYDVPAWVVRQWRLRTTYIGQGELLAVPVALRTMADQLRGALLTWYIDNTSAAAAAIKGASPDTDNSPIALVGALLAAHLGTRIWVEYVASEQNPADVMSRDAYSNERIKSLVEQGVVVLWQRDFDRQDLLDLAGAGRLIEHWVTSQDPDGVGVMGPCPLTSSPAWTQSSGV